MKVSAFFFFFFVMIGPVIADNIHSNNFDGKIVTLEGTIVDKPRRYDKTGGRYVRYAFKLTSGTNHNHGDEYILVTYNTVLWGKKVGEFNHVQGEKVTLKGKYSQSTEKAKGGLVGSLEVNDFDIKTVEKMP